MIARRTFSPDITLAGVVLACVLCLAQPAHADDQATAPLLLATALSDHAVLQRGKLIPIAGTATPGESVTVTLAAQTVRVKADQGGLWRAFFSPLAAGGPYTLTASGSDGRQAGADDLLIGDVWLCSGQSNMELPVERALNSQQVIAESADIGLRLLTVPKISAATPALRFAAPSNWQTADPTSVSNFSAVCHAMGKRLRSMLKVPIGLIHASWGGSQSRAWLSPSAALAMEGTAETALLRRYATDEAGALALFAPRWQAWYRSIGGSCEPWANPDCLNWKTVPQPGSWHLWTGTPLASQPTGTVWLRRSVTLSEAQARSAARLSLGVLDELDMTIVNGRPVGNTFSWDKLREYSVPAGYLHPGTNEIMIAVTNGYGSGGMVSGEQALALTLADSTRLPLESGWRYAAAPPGNPPRAPWDTIGGLGVLHNGMIAPLGTIPLRGVAWYQGESDVGIPGYDRRLTALFAGWRASFGDDLRILVVQLAGFGARQTGPAPSGWAETREIQRQATLATPNASLVTAIDLGEPGDIHPANKIVLGERLALAATGIDLPAPRDARSESGGIRLRFSGVEGRLHSYSASAPIAFALCGDGEASCRFADAVIENDTIMIALDGRPATRVRYGWADFPIVNLVDGRGLPVPGFELRIEPISTAATPGRVR